MRSRWREAIFGLLTRPRLPMDDPALAGWFVGEDTQSARRIRLEAVHRDGHRFPMEMASSRLSAGASHIWQAFLRDMTEHEQAQSQRRAAEEKLAHQTLRDILT